MGLENDTGNSIALRGRLIIVRIIEMRFNKRIYNKYRVQNNIKPLNKLINCLKTNFIKNDYRQ